MTEPSLELMTFPCRFAVKIMGKQHEAFVSTMIEVVRVHAPDLNEADVVHRASSGGRYQAVTITIDAISRQQMDTIYQALTAHEMVKVVL